MKNEWFTLYLDDYSMDQRRWYRTESRVQKRYINRLFNKTDKEIVCRPIDDSSDITFSLEEFVSEINSDANKQSKIRKYCREKFAEYWI